MTESLITSPAGIIAVLAIVTSFFFFLEKKTGSPLFNYLPPLIFIYLTPVLLSNTGFIPSKAPVYDFMGDVMLPVILVIMLLEVNILATIRVMGKGLFVMLIGTLGVVVGAPIGLVLVKHGLGPEVWKGFGALAGSWIGGTGNMLSVAYALELNESSLDFGYAVIADNAVYLIWLPILLGSKSFADKFNKFTGITKEKIAKIDKAASELVSDKGKMEMRHFLYLFMIGFGVTAISAWMAGYIPPITTTILSDAITRLMSLIIATFTTLSFQFIELTFSENLELGQVIFSTSTYKILLVTFLGIVLSFTKASRIPGSHALAMAMIYMFVARMGAKADLSGLSVSVFWFLLGAFIWIFIHGAFLLAAARAFKVDVHIAAISSAANIGGAASAPIVAAYHKPSLVPVSILMALIGYAIGNPAAILAAMLCRLVM